MELKQFKKYHSLGWKERASLGALEPGTGRGQEAEQLCECMRWLVAVTCQKQGLCRSRSVSDKADFPKPFMKLVCSYFIKLLSWGESGSFYQITSWGWLALYSFRNP